MNLDVAALSVTAVQNCKTPLIAAWMLFHSSANAKARTLFIVELLKLGKEQGQRTISLNFGVAQEPLI